MYMRRYSGLVLFLNLVFVSFTLAQGQVPSSVDDKASQPKGDLSVPVDTIYNFSTETAHLSLTVSKDNIYVGECSTVTLAFQVREDNPLRLQFHDLGAQLSEILRTSLNLPDVMVINNNINDIVGEKAILNNWNYTTYKIYQAAYCPVDAKPLRLLPVKLKMLIWKRKDVELEKIAEFNSLPVTVNVKPLPSFNLSTYNRYRMVGKFAMEEELEEDTLHVGMPTVYKVKLSGEGLVFPIEPPRSDQVAFKVNLLDIRDNDSIINEVLHSEKTFIYRVVPITEGRHELGTMIHFSFFNPLTKQQETIRSSLSIIAHKGPEQSRSTLTDDGSFYSRSSFIAIDASQSMMIEDYQPSRLSAVKDGVKKFLQGRSDCQIGIITFSGNAHHFHTGANTPCYSSARVDSISCLPKSGTAIGDAIWLARVSLNPDTEVRKIVVIGDGDNTAGFLSPLYAAELAKKNNIRIYTIGVGNTGPVPYGRNQQGHPYMIDNTFTDIDFKKISQVTGGKYYYARDADAINEILNKIFHE
jgi:hypothetical protein